MLHSDHWLHWIAKVQRLSPSFCSSNNDSSSLYTALPRNPRGKMSSTHFELIILQTNLYIIMCLFHIRAWKHENNLSANLCYIQSCLVGFLDFDTGFSILIHSVSFSLAHTCWRRENQILANWPLVLHLHYIVPILCITERTTKDCMLILYINVFFPEKSLNDLSVS